MSIFSFLLILFVYVCLMAVILARERIYYTDFERSNLSYWNPKYYGFVTLTARRYSRNDSVHYVNLHYQTLVPLGNNVTVDVYLYEFLSNEYRRSFVEMHYKLCDMVLLSDNVFGKVFAAAMPVVFRKCPFPMAEYRLENLTYLDLPVLKTFPFQKGRVFVNFTVPLIKERLLECYIDMVIKSRWR